MPELFSELRGLIDRGRRHGRRTGRFLVLGSAAVELLRQAGESLAGRIEFVSLTPLDVLEVAADRRAAISLWVRGGLPDSFLASSDDDSFAFRTNFIRTYLERDVAEFVSSRLPTETLGRLWTMLAHWQGGLLRASELARSLAINTATVGRYIDSLTSLFILRRLPPFVANVRKRLVKSPKVYIRDSGLVHALLRIGDFDTLAGHPVSGASWEGFVIENLLAAAPPGTGAQRAAGGVAGVESVNPDDGQIEDAYYGAWLHYGFTSWANGAPGPRSRLVRISPRPATHCGWRAWLSAAAGLGSL